MWTLIAWALAADPSIVRGVTVSTPTYGVEWGAPEMARTLDVLQSDGANWISYHPYARVDRDGSVRSRLDPDAPPDWLVRPIREAHARGLKVMVKPHLAYWGRFAWRGDITFEDPAERARFFREYTAWIVALARATAEADAFVVGTELDGIRGADAEWRQVIAAVRAVHPGHLTYAANWDTYERVGFWDALDCIGIQAYFPLVAHDREPTDAELRAGWRPHLARLADLSRRTGKPVVFTELGYDASPDAARTPWASGRGAPELQERLVRVALEVVEADPVVTGLFLWKWFPGEVQRGDFRVSRPPIRAVLRDVWSDTAAR
jgi:hypothetical protein